MEKGKPIRKRLAQACSPCRRKKTKCDGIKPNCMKCKRLDEMCSYDLKSYKKPALEQLEVRLKNIEKALLSKPTLSQRQALFCTTAIPHSENHVTFALLKKNDFDQLPCLEIVLELADIYFNQLHIIAPVLDKMAFLESIMNKTCCLFVLYSVMAVAARFSKRPEVLVDPIWKSGEKYAIKAREMIADVIEKPSLDVIHGFLLLSFHEYGCDEEYRCWMYSGIASRMTAQIELSTELMYNIKPGTIFPIKEWIHFEIRRKIYWNTFMNDKFSSVCTGKPSFLDHTGSNLLLPTGFNSIPEHDFSQQSADQSTTVYYHLHRHNGIITDIEYRFVDSPVSEYSFDNVMMKGAIILNKIARFLSRYKGSFDAEFIKLNQELDDWFNHFPPSLKETQANLERCKYENSEFTTYYVLVHTYHKSLIVLLNRPLLSMPCNEEINIYLNKCQSAANGVAALLNEINDRIEHIPPLAGYLTYIVGTVAINNSFSLNIYEGQKAEMARRVYFHFLGKMRLYWATADKLYCMMIELYNKNILEGVPLLEYTPIIQEPSIIEDIYKIFNTIDTFSLNNT